MTLTTILIAGAFVAILVLLYITVVDLLEEFLRELQWSKKDGQKEGDNHAGD